MKTARSWIAVAIVVAIGADARAQSAEAEMLFREGKRLLKKGEIAAACEKLEASERLEASIGTELNLGDCREKNGQTASAWAMFVKAAAAAKRTDDDRGEVAKQRAAALEKRLVYLTVNVPPESAIDDLVVKRDDTVVDRGEWNQAVPVDPAKYSLSAEAPGRETWTDTVVVKAKNKVIEVPKLEHADDDGKPRAHRKHAAAESEPEHHEGPRRYKAATVTLAIAGIGATAIATGFALYSQNVESQSDTLCPASPCTSSRGVDLNSTARLDGWIANVGWGIGGAALVGAVVTYVLGAPEDTEAPVSVIPLFGGDRAGLAIGGRF